MEDFRAEIIKFIDKYFGSKKSFRSLIPAIGSFFQIVNRYNRIR